MKHLFGLKIEVDVEANDLKKDGEQVVNIDSVQYDLRVGNTLRQNMYIGENNLPTLAGHESITMCCVETFIANIHLAHDSDQWDSAAHLRHIINRLEEGFTRADGVITTQQRKGRL